MSNPDFVYTTYIKTTPQKVWGAITTPEFTRQYWLRELHSDWKKGSKWQHLGADHKTPTIAGEILESSPPRRLVMTWADCDNPEQGTSKVSFDIEAVGGELTRLTVIHSDLLPEMAGKISGGWPRVLSSMKSFLETGMALNISATKACA